jgi:biotin/methionine sulfoxide reductase
LYESWRTLNQASSPDLPAFDEFWERGFVELSHVEHDIVAFQEFRKDPEHAPLPSASGKFEIYSEAIAEFGYGDCPPHPVWMEPKEWLRSPETARFPLQLVANNPASRLHSQLDPGALSQSSKVQGREPVRLNPEDAAARGISDGDIVRIFNERGSCLAGARISERVRPSVIQLSTGAWYDPLDPADFRSLCVHGNPNVLTFDKGTSSLGQGCSGQLALVEVERFDGELPPIRAYDPPESRPE